MTGAPREATASRQLLEAASWRVVAELVRRQPHLAAIETHPGGGQSDCLAILQPGSELMSGASIQLNRPGSAHIQPFDGSPHVVWREFWPTYLAARDPREVLLDLERRAGLTAPPSVPRSGRPAIAYRVIAAILATASFGRTVVECRNGMFDTAGWGGGRRDDAFALFPEAAARSRRLEPDDLLREPAYRFWFINRGGEPVLAFEPSAGLAWSRSSGQHDLDVLWRRAGRRPALVAAWVAGDAIP